MKKVLDYGSIVPELLPTFFTNVKTIHDSPTGKFDIVILSRDNLQDNFDNVIQYLHENTKVIVNIVTESGCIDDFIVHFSALTEKHSEIPFYLIVDSEFEHNFGKNVKVCSSFKLSLLAYFENFSYSKNKQNYIIDYANAYDKENGFCCLNGRIRTHRILLLLELVKRNLLDENKNNDISFLFYSHGKSTDYDLYSSMIENDIYSKNDLPILESLKNKLPIKLHGEDGLIPSLVLDDSSCKKVLALVTENVASIDCGITHLNTVTVTEKAWRPFKLHQIPIYISMPGYVSTLRSLGFDLFDDIINHDYDNELDNVKRIKKAVDELENVMKMNLLDFYEKNHTRFIRNNILCESLKLEGYSILKNFMLDNELI